MSRSYWLPVIAAVGLALSSSGSAFAKPPPPNDHRVSASTPSIKKQPANGSYSDPYPTADAPLPVRVIPSIPEAEHSEARERKSDEHDAKDLDAQVRAADAAEKQVFAAWMAAILGFAGTVLIVWSLKEARSANATSREAIALSEQNSRQELRAYIAAEPGPIGWLDGTNQPAPPDVPQEFQYRARIHNYGATPAHHVRQIGRLRILPYPLPADFDFTSQVPEYHSISTLHPTEEDILSVNALLTPRQVAALSDPAAQERIYVYGCVAYMIVFGEGRTTNFCFVVQPALGQGKVISFKYKLNNYAT
jgi:hypothetical protein